MIKSQIAQLKSKNADKMILVEGGKFLMGSSNFEDSKPLHQVELNSFYMDEHEVTNAQFAQFVKETGYVTVAERELDPKDFPGVDPKMLVRDRLCSLSPKNLIH
ncbi:formylglycine-generating enzyme family protein [Sphingobacterium multivorum]|nr:SUMF1/EgtB/PvdO family nonheme iron enzyme [Sphingobacterium multivorum]